MDLPVLHRHSMNSQLLGDEVDGVQSIFHLLDLSIFGHAPWAGDGGAQVEGGNALKETLD